MRQTKALLPLLLLATLVAACGDGLRFPGGLDDAGTGPDPGDPDAAPVPECTPTTCAQAGKNCGPVADGCGGLIDCGTCDAPESCGGGGVPSVCGGPGVCVPMTCAELGANCGWASDGCSGVVHCGDCTVDGDSCGGDGVPNVCGQKDESPLDCPALQTCADQGIECGPAGNGCGGLIDSCGTCGGGSSCGGGGIGGLCGAPACTPQTCASAGASCGPIGDGCGGVIGNCGNCSAGDICGGGGTPSVCGGGPGSNPDCTGLCLDQVACPGGGATAVTGTVYAPNGTLPLYNAVVYVSNGPLPAITDGASCDRCEDEDLGFPLVSTLSGADGSFTLNHVPADVPFPLVIKMGKWRRVVMIDPVDPCTTEVLDAEQTRLPRNQSEGHLPLMAISTGRVDPLECLLRKIGIDDDEFSRPSGTGRVRMYRPLNTVDSSVGAGGAWPDQAARNCNNCGNGSTAGELSCRTTWCGCPDLSCKQAVLAEISNASLIGNQATLDGYDVAVFACEARRTTQPGSGGHGNFQSYVGAGGRAFLSHWSDLWLFDQPPFSALADWVALFPWGDHGPTLALVDETFPKGAVFTEWLDHVGASHLQTGQIQIHDPRQHVNSVEAGVQPWVYTTDPPHGASSIQQMTFNTPVGVPEPDQCGRVAYSAFHVVHVDQAHFDTRDDWFPDHCTDDPLTPQEKILAFMLFDLAACVSDDNFEPPPPPTCSPATCAGVQCGAIADGCGSFLECDACPAGQTCVHNQCVIDCEPLTCQEIGVECGLAGNGCGGTMNCGPCPPGETCGGGGQPGICGSVPCEPITCESVGATCGSIGDGCGGLDECGDCPPPQTCGGGGVPNQCGGGCMKTTCEAADAECGLIPDGCGGVQDCGDCEPPESCGGLGIPNKCGFLG